MSSRRQLIGRLAAAVIAQVVALGLAEIAVRWLAPQPVLLVPPLVYKPDPPGYYGLRAGFRGRVTNRTEFDHEVVINSQGLRNDELAPKKAGTVRILFLGDSFTFGVGVEQEDSFPARVQAELATRGIPIEAVNAGVPGYGTAEQATWLERRPDLLDSDLVVLGVFVGNDLHDAKRLHGAVDHVVERSPGTNTTGAWVYHNSHLYLLAQRAIPGLVMSRVRDALGIEDWLSREMLDEISPCATHRPPWVEGAIAITGDSLDRILASTTPRGVPLVAVLIPDGSAVDPERWDSMIRQLDVDPTDYDPERCDAIFVDLLRRREIPMLDLRPALGAALASGNDPYYHYDRHFSLAGHTIAGAQIARYLETRLPIEGAVP
ncbi:MAG: GDSL-type esterase/lipase family protein [Acidobacteriota bacterium]